MDLLQPFACDEIFTEKMSGTIANRPELEKLLGKVRSGDTVVVESFSRLGRSTKNLIELVETFESKGVKLISAKENFDTGTPQGRLMMTVFQAFSQFERDIIAERTKEGLTAARARGRKGGRKPINPKTIEKAIKMYQAIYIARFDTFYAAYPLNVGRASAEKAFNKIGFTEDKFTEMMTALEAQTKMLKWMEEKLFIPNPAMWFKQRRH